jgi:competence protein ComEA
MDDNINNNYPIILLSWWKNYKIPILLGTGSVLFIILSVVLLVKSVQTTAPIRFETRESTASGQPLAEIIIDIEGGVVNPGVYHLAKGSRLDDAIKIAGGLNENADQNYISERLNKAQILVDGGKILIPVINGTITSHNNSFATCTGMSQNCSPVVTTSSQTSQNRAENPSNTNLISINDATESELDSLSGVGPVTAQKIISNRPYQTLEDLVAKKAVGESVYNKIKDLISL